MQQHPGGAGTSRSANADLDQFCSEEWPTAKWYIDYKAKLVGKCVANHNWSPERPTKYSRRAAKLNERYNQLCGCDSAHRFDKLSCTSCQHRPRKSFAATGEC